MNSHHRSARPLLQVDDEDRLRQAQYNRPPQVNAGLSMLLNSEHSSGGLDAAGMRVRLAGLHEGWVIDEAAT